MFKALTSVLLIAILSSNDGFIVSRVPKSDHNYITCKLQEDISAADINPIQNFFLQKEGFFMCDVKADTDVIKVEVLPRVNTDNVKLIIEHLGYHVDTNWKGDAQQNR